MIDALFGSKTRVKLLHLFLNNPGKAFYVREITRLIDEQINSVRRELSNMLQVGIILSDSADNKLYYEVNPKYDHYQAFRDIFGDSASREANKQQSSHKSQSRDSSLQTLLEGVDGLRVAVAAGALVQGSASRVDLLLVGGVAPQKVTRLVSVLEKSEGRELTYSLMSYDEFYYRLSVRDRFISEILQGKHDVLIDTDEILKDK